MFQPPFKRQKGERPAKNPETIIQGQVRDALRLDGWYVIRHQQGMGSHPGLSDLTAIKDGVTIYVEIKTPRGYQSVSKAFINVLSLARNTLPIPAPNPEPWPRPSTIFLELLLLNSSDFDVILSILTLWFYSK